MALRYHSHRHGGGFHRIMPLPPPQPPTHHISSLSCPTLFDLRISLCWQYPNRRTGGPQSINSAWGVVPPSNIEPSSFDAGTIDQAETGGGDLWSSKGVRFGRDEIWGRPRASSHTTIIWGRTGGASWWHNRLLPCSSIIIQSQLSRGISIILTYDTISKGGNKQSCTPLSDHCMARVWWSYWITMVSGNHVEHNTKYGQTLWGARNKPNTNCSSHY
jgi:hypothetical protein